jgi:mannose-6-phosphate isomerase-like protein (cupin superfamily)
LMGPIDLRFYYFHSFVLISNNGFELTRFARSSSHIRYGERIMIPSKINLAEKFSMLPDEDYSLRIVAKMNEYEFKIVKFKGEFVWHSHTDTDETFIILKGKMLMNFRDKIIELNAGEMIVIPKGVEHKPTSEKGYEALLIEPEGVPNTGDVESEMAIKKVEWI